MRRRAAPIRRPVMETQQFVEVKKAIYIIILFLQGKYLCTDSASSNSNRQNDVGQVKYEIQVLAVVICKLGPLYLVTTDVLFMSVHTARPAISDRALLQRKASRAAERTAVGVPTRTPHPSHFSRSSRPEGVRDSRPALPEPPNCLFKEMYCTDSMYRVCKGKLENCSCSQFQ